MNDDYITNAELRAGLIELELKLRTWADDKHNALASKEQLENIERRFEGWCRRLDQKPIDELKIREIAKSSIEKDQSDQWSGRSRLITVILFFGSVATTVTTLLLLVTNAN
jgi:hypothetical protein